MTRSKPTFVLKFGGASLAGAKRLRGAAAIVRGRARHGPVVVVVSAMAGVTDALVDALAAAEQGLPAWREAVGGLKRRHRQALTALACQRRSGAAARALEERLRTLEVLLDTVERRRGCPPGLRARILASGERLSSVLLAAALGFSGHRAHVVDGSELIVTPEGAREGAVDTRRTRCNIRRRLAPVDSGDIPVVTGFVAGDGAGGATLLGRGGSDLSATIVGAALEARRVEIWTDVPGILSAPPRWVPEARTLPCLSRAEAEALARWGGKVLHPGALGPLAASATELVVASSLAPRAGRTAVRRSRPGAGPVAVSGRGGVVLRASGSGGRTVLDPGDGRPAGVMMDSGEGGSLVELPLAAVALIGGLGPAGARELVRSLRLPVLGIVPGLAPGATGLIVRERFLRRTVKHLHDALIAEPHTSRRLLEAVS